MWDGNIFDLTGAQVPADLIVRQNERIQCYNAVSEKQNLQEIKHFLDSFFFLKSCILAMLIHY